jgi:hypothetical protein
VSNFHGITPHGLHGFFSRNKHGRHGARLHHEREERGLSVTDAADRADFNSVLWLKIEAEAGEETPLSTPGTAPDLACT